MPLTTRVPQNGGSGTRLSVGHVGADRRRVGVASVSGGAAAAGATRRFAQLRQLRRPASPRLTAITASISRRPSKASRA